MTVYIGLFVLIIVLYLMLKDKKDGKKIYCIIIGTCMALIAGLRNEKMGLTDTEFVYKVTFERILNNNFEYALSLKDTLFQILTYFFTRIVSDNYKVYVLTFTIPYIAAVSFLIYKYSNRKWLSFIIFMCLQYFEISFTLIRQINGMALLILALHFLIEDKNLKFIMLVLLASCFHTICITFLILLPLKKLKFKKWVLYVYVVGLLIFLFFPQEILEFVYTLLKNKRFTRYKDLNRVKNRVFFVMNFVFWIVELLNYSENQKHKDKLIMFWSSTVCLIISPLTVALGEFSRIAYLFGISHIILLPESIELVKQSKQKVFLEFGIALLFLVYFLYFLGPEVNVIPYRM